MFSTEYNGYNKTEVDKYIARLKAEHEASLMEEKLKVLESEKKLLDYKNKSYDIENREKNIMSALDAFRRFQDEGNNNIKTLHYEQIKMINEQLQLSFKQLCIQFPELSHSATFSKMFNDLERILSQAEVQPAEITSMANTENDSMRILLTKMQGYRRGQDSPREVKIVRAQEERKNQIRPVSDMSLDDNDPYDNLVDKFLSTQPEEKHEKSIKQEGGFDLKEAINPKDDLAEIMKAFDFFNENNFGIN